MQYCNPSHNKVHRTSQFATGMKHDEHRELDISDPSTIAQIQIRFQLNAKVTPTRNLTLQLVPYIKYLTMQLSQDHHDIISNYSNCISQLSTNLKN